MSTETFTLTALSGVTSTETPFVVSEAPKASWTRLSQLPFMPTTPGTSRMAMATIFSMTPLENVRESSESESSAMSISCPSTGSGWAAGTGAATMAASTGASAPCVLFSVSMLTPLAVGY